MKYLVDTDWVVDYLQGHEPAQSTLPRLMADGIAISIITYTEYLEGVLGSRDPQQAQANFRAFLRPVPILGITRRIGRTNAQLRLTLRLQRRPIEHRAFDLLIAATALSQKLTLVTRNTRHYNDIPSLNLY